MDQLKQAANAAAHIAGNIYHTNEMEHRTRRERGFHTTEASLPDIKKGDAASVATHLLSHLGSLNPLPQPVTAADTLWLFDNTAFRSALTGKWEAEFVASFWEQKSGMEVSKAVADIAEKVGLGKGDAAEKTIADRLMPFMQDILPGRHVTVDVSGKSDIVLGPGGRNAISSDVRKVPDAINGQVVETKAQVPSGTNGLLSMKTVYAEPEGWGVISDIDDTIKITQTSDPIGILRSTFVSTPTPIAGMPEFYKSIVSLIGPAAPFFYLSASPYNLYAFLRDFREQYYPQGTIVLRDASWMNLSGLLSNLTLGTQEYKVSRIQKIHTWLPKRKMICIGDSTQSDPEAYAATYRAHPGWVKLILIRKVDDIAAIGIEDKNKPERFETAFKGIPRDVWHVFEEPAECQALVERIVGANGGK